MNNLLSCKWRSLAEHLGFAHLANINFSIFGSRWAGKEWFVCGICLPVLRHDLRDHSLEAQSRQVRLLLYNAAKNCFHGVAIRVSVVECP
jgi:hypothetical protein